MENRAGIPLEAITFDAKAARQKFLGPIPAPLNKPGQSTPEKQPITFIQNPEPKKMPIEEKIGYVAGVALARLASRAIAIPGLIKSLRE